MSNEQLCLNDLVLMLRHTDDQLSHLNELLAGQGKKAGTARYGVYVGVLPMSLVQAFTRERDGLARAREWLAGMIERGKAKQAANDRVTEEEAS